jgi:hypothetical protein
MKEKIKYYVIQSCGFVLNNAVLDKKNESVEKKSNFIASRWKIVSIFVAMYCNL